VAYKNIISIYSITCTGLWTQGLLWSWLYGNWVYKYLCNQCISLLKLQVRTQFMARFYRHFQQYFSYIVAVNFIGGGNWNTRRNPPACHKSLTNFIMECWIENTSPWTGFELVTLVMICTDCTGTCRPNYHTITTTTAPEFINQYM
jgi:hypothetical protein